MSGGVIFRGGQWVTYAEGCPAEGYAGEFVRYEQHAETGGDCIVRWHVMEGRWLPAPVEAREYAQALGWEFVRVGHSRFRVLDRRPVPEGRQTQYTVGVLQPPERVVEVCNLLESDGYGRLWYRLAGLEGGADERWQALGCQGDLWTPEAPEELPYYGGRLHQKEFVGLFWYSGFGQGTLYLPDGTARSCTTTEGVRLAKQWGLAEQYKLIDSMRYYRPTALGDR